MSACRALQQPRVSLYEVNARRDWERIYDRATQFRHDDAVERAVEQMSRRPMGRRSDVRFRSAGVRSLAAQFRGTFFSDIGGVPGASDIWCDASFVAVDGGSGKLQSWVDYVDNTHILTQATSGLQAAVPATDALFGGATCATFASTYYTSNRPDYRPGHDGTGFRAYLVFSQTATSNSCILSTMPASSGFEVGFALFSYLGANFRWFVGSGAAGPVSAIGNATAPLTTGTYMRTSLATGAYEIAKKATVGASGVAGTLASGASTAPLRLGANSAGGAPFGGKIRAVYLYRRVLDAAADAVVQQYIQRDTGITP